MMVEATTAKGGSIVTMSNRLASNLEEVGEHMADTFDWEDDAHRPHAIAVFVENYVEQHPEDFEEMGEHQYRYVGRSDDPTDETDDVEAVEDDGKDDGDDGKVSFSLGDDSARWDF